MKLEAARRFYWLKQEINTPLIFIFFYLEAQSEISREKLNLLMEDFRGFLLKEISSMQFYSRFLIDPSKKKTFRGEKSLLKRD